jgi:hypothetical protein
VLDWRARDEPPHSARLALTRKLLAVRKRAVVPLLRKMTGEGAVNFESGLLNVRWPAADKTLYLLANLSNAAAPRGPGLDWGEPIWGGALPRELPPWSVYAAIGGG